MIVWVDVVLNRTVAVTVNDVSTTYAVVIIRVGKVSSSVDGFKLWFFDLIGPDVFEFKSRCFWSPVSEAVMLLAMKTRNVIGAFRSDGLLSH